MAERPGKGKMGCAGGDKLFRPEHPVAQFYRSKIWLKSATKNDVLINKGIPMAKRKASRSRDFLIPVLGLCLFSCGLINLLQKPDPIAAITGRTPVIDPARLYGRWVLEGDGSCAMPRKGFEYRSDGTVYYPGNTFETSWHLEGDSIIETLVEAPVVVPREQRVAALYNELKQRPPTSLDDDIPLEAVAAASVDAQMAAEEAMEDTPPPRILRLDHDTMTLDYGFAKGRLTRCGARAGSR